MCEKAPELNKPTERGKPGYPDSDRLFAMALKEHRKKYPKSKDTRGLMQDIDNWQGHNEWAWDWDLRMILLGYYMRTTHKKCWDIIQGEWVKVA